MMKDILLVIDMQKDFIDGALGTKEAENIVGNVLNKIEEYINFNKSIYFTMDSHEDNYLLTQEGRKLPVEHCVKGTEGWKLDSRITEVIDKHRLNKTDVIFEKNGFGSIDLANLISKTYEDSDETNIEIVGLCTDICVITNAILLKTYMPNSNIYVNSSCCAGVTEKSHFEALNTMKMCQINII